MVGVTPCGETTPWYLLLVPVIRHTGLTFYSDEVGTGMDCGANSK